MESIERTAVIVSGKQHPPALVVVAATHHLVRDREALDQDGQALCESN